MTFVNIISLGSLFQTVVIFLMASQFINCTIFFLTNITFKLRSTNFRMNFKVKFFPTSKRSVASQTSILNNVLMYFLNVFFQQLVCSKRSLTQFTFKVFFSSNGQMKHANPNSFLCSISYKRHIELFQLYHANVLHDDVMLVYLQKFHHKPDIQI